MKAPATPRSAALSPSNLLRGGAAIAAGALASRATGFVRAAVVAAALGVGLTADGYAVANSVPTVLYTMLMGGALNAVFLTELVRAAKTTPTAVRSTPTG